MIFFTIIVFSSLSICSAFKSEIQNRVVNGTNASEGEYPFVASLRSSSGAHLCGCSIINEEWFLTAAHCVEYTRPSQLTIQYGVLEISQNGPNILKVKKIISHKGYDPYNTYIHDIALVQVEPIHSLEFNNKVQPIKLPNAFYEPLEDSAATLLGWGLEKSGGSIQTNLQKVELRTFNNTECSRRLFGQIHESNMCAGVPEGGKGQCNGDSGGPLIVDGMQLGIVSWSVKPCTLAPYPGVFTKVSHYINWILGQISNNI